MLGQFVAAQLRMLQQMCSHVVVSANGKFTARNETVLAQFIVDQPDVKSKSSWLEIRFAAVLMQTFEVFLVRVNLLVMMELFHSDILTCAAFEVAFEIPFCVGVFKMFSKRKEICK